jgi:polyisoprenoid-binding protein YceI
MHRSSAVLFAVMMCSSFAFASQAYEIDRSGSQAKFSIRHFAETVEGTFNDISGSIAYDPADVSKSKVHVVIKIASVDTHSSQRDHHLQGGEFFDAGNFPEMIFDSQRIEKRASGLMAIGNFTMRGTTKSIEIPFTLAVPGNDPSHSRMSIHGTVAVNRREYKVGSNEMVDNQLTLGDEVKIELNVQAIPVR